MTTNGKRAPLRDGANNNNNKKRQTNKRQRKMKKRTKLAKQTSARAVARKLAVCRGA
jgi:hypothetical protein